jgi:predicted ATPase
VIKAISITNFKAIGDPGIRIEIEPITMLFGNNNSGKSTVFQALSLADEIFNKGNRNPELLGASEAAIDVGGFGSFVHAQELGREIELRFELDLKRIKFDQEWKIEPTLLKHYGQLDGIDLGSIGDDIWQGAVSIGLVWDKSLNSAKVVRYSVELNNDHLLDIESPSASASAYPASVNVAHSILRWPDGTRFGRHNSYGVLDELVSDFRSDIVELFQFAEVIPADEFPVVGDAEYTRVEYDIDDSVMEVRKLDIAANLDRFSDYMKKLCEDVVSYAPEYDQVNLYFVLWDHGEVELAAITITNPVDSDDSDATSQIDTMLEEWFNRLRRQNWVRINQSDALPSWTDRIPFDFPLASMIESDEDDSSRFRMACELLNRLLIVPGRVLARELKKLCHIGPLRKPPKRDLNVALTLNQNQSIQWYDGSSAWHSLARNPELASNVSGWLSDSGKLGMGYELKLQNYREVPIDGLIARCFAGNDQVNLDLLADASQEFNELPIRVHIKFVNVDSTEKLDAADLAIGFNQIIPVLTAALDDRNGLVLIEQPELHIHPSVEVGLGDMFIQGIQEGKQFLLETHGEHLMLRMLRRIRETTDGTLPNGVNKLLPDKLAIYYIERSADGVAAKRLHIDERGEFIDKWPKGFFRERSKELF